MSRFILGFLLLTLTFSTPAYAQEETQNEAMSVEVMVEPVATVIEIEGSAAVKDSTGASAQLAVDAPIFESDEILTSAESKVLLLFIDDTELTIGENADVKINDFTYEADEDGKKSAYISFLRGAFLFVSGKVGKMAVPDVNLETPYASIGIRGTVVWGGTLDDEYNVFVQEGAVSVRNERGATMVREGEGTTLVDRRTFPTRSKTWEEAKINRAVSTIALARTSEVKTMLDSRRGKLFQDRNERRALRRVAPKNDGENIVPDTNREDTDKQGNLVPREREDKTGVNSNLKDKAEQSLKDRNKDREKAFQKRIKTQRENR